MSTTSRSVKPEVVASILLCPISLAGDRLLFRSALTYVGTLGIVILAMSILGFQYFERIKLRR